MRVKSKGLAILCVYTIVFAADDQAEIEAIRTKVEQAGEIRLNNR